MSERAYGPPHIKSLSMSIGVGDATHPKVFLNCTVMTQFVLIFIARCYYFIVEVIHEQEHIYFSRKNW